MTTETLSSQDRILRCKIQLQKEKPFWSFLLSYLKIEEMDKEFLKAVEAQHGKGSGTMCINANTDELSYNPEWVDKLDENELKGVLAHEVGHLAFDTLDRRNDRDPNVFNVASDIMINNILINDSFELPKGGLLPHNNEITIEQLKLTIKDLNTLTTEEVYDKVVQKCPKSKQIVIQIGNSKAGEGKDQISIKGFDSHITKDKKKGNKDGKGKEKGKDGNISTKDGEGRWTERIIEAVNIAKMMGNLPAGLEGLVSNLVHSKVSWKTLLHKYISQHLPYDKTFARPNKRSQSVGFYMPSMKKENLDVTIAIDTSGSIGQDELTTFVSEIVHIAKTTSNLKMTVIQCDADVQDIMEITNGNIQKIKDIKIKGGGGTDFRPVFEKTRTDLHTTRVLVYFTDGYGTFPTKKYSWDTIWALTSNSIPEKDVPFGKTIKVKQGE